MSNLVPSLQARQDACTHKQTDPLFLSKNDLKKIGDAVHSPDRQTQYPLPAARERFCQIVAFGHLPKYKAYAEAFEIALLDPAVEHPDLITEQTKALSSDASALMANTTIRLRVAELRRPVVRKLQKKFEYDLQKALSQANIAWETAFEDGDTGNMLKSIELQSKLAKLLSEEINVTHKFGAVDDASTEVLLAIRDEVEKRKTRQKRLQTSITVEAVTIQE